MPIEYVEQEVPGHLQLGVMPSIDQTTQPGLTGSTGQARGNAHAVDDAGLVVGSVVEDEAARALRWSPASG